MGDLASIAVGAKLFDESLSPVVTLTTAIDPTCVNDAIRGARRRGAASRSAGAVQNGSRHVSRT